MAETQASRHREQRWWALLVEAGKRHEKLLARVAEIRKNQLGRKERDREMMRMYGQTVRFGNRQNNRMASGGSRRVSMNAAKCVADSFTAKVTKQPPKVSIVPDGGDWELAERAKGLTKFLAGEFHEKKIHEMGPQVVLDGGGVFGTGFFFVFREGEKKQAQVNVERVFPSEILVDESEGRCGVPRNLYRERWLDRCVLEDMYADEPEKLAAIQEAQADGDTDAGDIGYDPSGDQLRVIEGWHLPSSKKAKDGRFTRAILGCDLEDEEWTYHKFPFFRYMRSLPLEGYFGISLCDDVQSLQNEINTIMIQIGKAHRLLGAGHVMCERNAKVNFSQWDNVQGSKIEYTNTPPTIVVPSILVAPEQYTYLNWLKNQCFSTTGTPQPFSQGEVPENLESGKAQEVNLDITDQRMQVAINRYHQLFVEVADYWLFLARDIVKNHNENYGAKAMSRPGAMRKVLLRETDMEEDEYVLKEWPTNALVDEPGERQKQVMAWANAGWITPDTAKRLIQVPDLEEEQDLESASYNAVEECISEMLNEGRYRGPIPQLNLMQAIRQVVLASIRAWTDRRPEARQELLRNWIAEASALLSASQAPAPQMPQQMASAPGTPLMGGGGAGAPQPVMAAPPAAANTPPMAGAA